MRRLLTPLRTLRARLTLEGKLRLEQPWALVIAATALALALFFPARWLLFIGYVYTLLLVGAYLWVRAGARGLTLRRSLRSAWAQVGDDLEEGWELVNRAALPMLGLEIEDGSTLPGYNARRVIDAEGGEGFSWRTTARCGRRGRYKLGPHTARCRDPLGLFSYSRREHGDKELVVYPPLLRLPALSPPHGQRGGHAQADLLQLFATPSVGALRAYTPGDPLSRIHWPYVARYDQLIVKEFDQERSGALWIVLDLAADAYPALPAGTPESEALQADHYGQSSVAGDLPTTYHADSPVELAVALAGSLAAQTLAAGRTVGLLYDDGTRLMLRPGGGAAQLWRLLAALVDGAATGRRPLAELLRSTRRAGELGGGALAVITGDLAGPWPHELASGNGGRPGGAMALLVSARAGDAAPQATRLRGAGCPTTIFELGAPLPLANPPRRRVTARVSPLGKVIKQP